MAITHIWSLNGPALGDLARGVIRQVPWRLTTTDGVNSVQESGTVMLPDIAVTDPKFVSLTKVTTFHVIGWVKAALGEAAVAQWEADAAANLAAKFAPKLVPLIVPDAKEASGVAMTSEAIAMETAQRNLTTPEG